MTLYPTYCLQQLLEQLPEGNRGGSTEGLGME